MYNFENDNYMQITYKGPHLIETTGNQFGSYNTYADCKKIEISQNTTIQLNPKSIC